MFEDIKSKMFEDIKSTTTNQLIYLLEVMSINKYIYSFAFILGDYPDIFLDINKKLVNKVNSIQNQPIVYVD